jgi:threonine synthase
MILDALKRSGGSAVAVADDAIRAEVGTMAREMGLHVSLESAAACAGLRRLVDDGAVDRDERVVLFSTGSGLKSPAV